MKLRYPLRASLARGSTLESRGPIPNQGVGDDTSPVEGSIFQWLEKNGVPFDNMGEDLGGGKLDPIYGFVSTSKTVPDTRSACYMAGRARVTCDLKPFTYAWYVNDHTFGAAAGKPNPSAMIAVNDEATGMFLDAVSHSPLWKSTLVVVVEDDPQDGADHVDAHRSIVLLASPWVKRSYVSHTHFDVSSLHKLFAHLYGIPYNNQTVAEIDSLGPLNGSSGHRRATNRRAGLVNSFVRANFRTIPTHCRACRIDPTGARTWPRNCPPPRCAPGKRLSSPDLPAVLRIRWTRAERALRRA